MTINLRTATPDDIPAIIALQTQIWEPTYRDILSADQIQYMFDQLYAPDALLNQMTVRGHTFVLAETQTDEQTPELVGFASYGLAGKAADVPVGQAFKLHKIYVLPSTQGTGLGRQLLVEVELRCWQNGGNELLLNVNRYNKARLFYEKLGFQVIREEDVAIGPYWMNDFVMSKALTVCNS